MEIPGVVSIVAWWSPKEKEESLVRFWPGILYLNSRHYLPGANWTPHATARAQTPLLARTNHSRITHTHTHIDRNKFMFPAHQHADYIAFEAKSLPRFWHNIAEEIFQSTWRRCSDGVAGYDWQCHLATFFFTIPLYIYVYIHLCVLVCFSCYSKGASKCKSKKERIFHIDHKMFSFFNSDNLDFIFHLEYLIYIVFIYVNYWIPFPGSLHFVVPKIIKVTFNSKILIAFTYKL